EDVARHLVPAAARERLLRSRMSEQRKGGRPSKAAGPKVPYHEVDRLLVQGDVVVGDDGVETRVWPTQGEVAKRFGVSPGLIGTFAKQRRCTERRAEFEAKKKAEQAPHENTDASSEATEVAATPAPEPEVPAQ